MSELIDDQASKWRMSITHTCKSVFVINKDDIVHKYTEGVDYGSNSYHVTCPACGLDHYLDWKGLPSWVVAYAGRKGHK